MKTNDKVSGFPVDRLKNNPVYKVVVRGYPDSENLHSVSVISSKYKLTYRVGEWVQPFIGGIYVFDNCIDAHNFINTRLFIINNVVEMWLAVANECQNACFVLSDPSNSREIEYFWANPIRDYEQRAPKGSLVCSAVKLLKQIK